MKKSGFKRKPALTDAQRQQRDELLKWKRENRARGRSGALGSYHKGEYIPSRWQKECLIMLEWREKAGEISDLESQVDIPFTIYDQCGNPLDLMINVDFTFFDENLGRDCRWDAKPPKVVHTKHGRRYPQKLHEAWLLRWKLLQFVEPDFDYRLLEKGNCELDDLNIVRD